MSGSNVLRNVDINQSLRNMGGPAQSGRHVGSPTQSRRHMGSPRNSPKADRKKLKQTKNLQQKPSAQKQVRFGICFDVDGVLARGTTPFAQAKAAMKLLQDEKGNLKVPTAFVTNALNRNQDKADQIGSWFGIEIRPDQMVQAQGPLEVFTRYHNKHCLLIGQGKILDIAKDLGFKNICTIEDVKEAYPLLDVADHQNRIRLTKQGYEEKGMKKIEAIILLGEPKRWESSLQLLVDILMTDGMPSKAPETPPEKHIPVIACNMDLLFMERACMPRYGHGAYLLCLEALYKKVSGMELQYTSLVGKPSEITFRYAEHCIAREAKRLGITDPIKRLYLIGDTPDVDIVGANLYQRYIDRLHTRISNNEIDNESMKGAGHVDPDLPSSRNVPADVSFSKQTVEEIEGVLVNTGVYKPGKERNESDEKHYHGHRDFPPNSELYKPSKITSDVETAIEYIIQKEGASFK